MNYFGKIISNISQAYSEINPATLTGSIDVIVVEQEDGTYLTSPFHVRFGKMSVLRSREKIVDIEINGHPVEIHMKLGDGGEAYFLEECDDDNDDDDVKSNQNEKNGKQSDLTDPSTDISSSESPLLVSSKPKNETIQDQTHRQDSNVGDQTSTYSVESTPNIQNTEDQIESNSIKTESLQSSGSQKRTRRKKKCKSSSLARPISRESDTHVNITSDFDNGSVSSIQRTDTNKSEEIIKNDLHHPFSDSEAESIRQKNTFQQTSDYKSDSEIFISKNNKLSVSDTIDGWDWGELPNVNKKDSLNSSKESRSMLGGVLNFMIKDKDAKQEDDDDKGIYLDELDPNDMNPEVAAKYFPKFRSSLTSKPITVQVSSDEDIESGKGPSLSNSPRSAEFQYQLSESFIDPFKEQLMIPCDLTSLSRAYHDMSMSLCGRIEDLLENTDNTERFLQSIISFDDFSENPLQILDNPNLVIRMGANYYTLKMATSLLFSLLLFQRPLPEKTIDFLKEKCIPKKINTQNTRSWRSWFRSPTLEPSSNTPTSPLSAQNNETTFSNNEQQLSSDPSSTSSSSYYFDNLVYDNDETAKNSIEYVSDEETFKSVVIPKTNGEIPTNTNTNTEKKKKYRKVLRLSSEVLKSLNLRRGSNDVMFSVTTAYQGTTACKSKIFLWNHDDRIIISDIDGTITKSDVLGHILPYIGKDWAQWGVTNLYSRIEKNGYRFLYLSARAIGQAKGTRDYLSSICQEDIYLPDGPLLLSPTSLFSALHREVIEKKPEEFKISCLKDIQTLFTNNPFFAGFGNKINDTWAYKAVGIDPSRIFTVNHKGELKLDKLPSFKSSYMELSDFVDQIFPPFSRERNLFDDDEKKNYDSFMYWRTDIPELVSLQN
ncbi:Phosphatidate phosphatase LPIN2 [Sarcoptes scabiei]|uniref:phosphatidate phosphatase n=1 Tax=Sarcoptes scabiei TaxID=52283 RepID=A0A834RHH7_SARSC|nr:Phosphatidate phosphatase LPIN2 [Sarcoptes scabiei]